MFHAASRSQLETSSVDHHVLYPWSVAYISLLRSASPITQSPRRVVHGSGWFAVTSITFAPGGPCGGASPWLGRHVAGVV